MKRTASSIIAQFLGRQNIIAIPVALVRLTGDYAAAAFLAQCIYWSERSTDADGWFYKTGAQWEEELLLSPKQTRRSVEACGGIVLVSRRGIPAKNYYRVDMELFLSALESLESDNKICPKVTTVGDERSPLVHDGRSQLVTEITSETTAERERPAASPKNQKTAPALDIDLPSQAEHGESPVKSEARPANSAHSTAPAAGGDVVQMFHDVFSYSFVSRYQKDLPRWAEQYTPAFLRLARDLANTLHGAKGQFTVVDLLNQDSRKPWPAELLQQYKADMKARQMDNPADRVPVVGEVLVCGPNSGRVLEVLHADRLVSIQTGDGPADYLTVPWASTQPAVRHSA